MLVIYLCIKSHPPSLLRSILATGLTGHLTLHMPRRVKGGPGGLPPGNQGPSGPVGPGPFKGPKIIGRRPCSGGTRGARKPPQGYLVYPPHPCFTPKYAQNHTHFHNIVHICYTIYLFLPLGAHICAFGGKSIQIYSNIHDSLQFSSNECKYALSSAFLLNCALLCTDLCKSTQIYSISHRFTQIKTFRGQILANIKK